MLSTLRLSTALAIAGTGFAQTQTPPCLEKFSFLPTAATASLGTSYTFTSEDNAQLKIVTSGYTIDGAPTEIYRKGNTAFGREDGIGFTVDAGNGKEIDRFHFLQVDFTQLKALSPATFTPQFQISSAQKSEDAIVYGSNVAGKLGVLLKTYNGNDSDIIPFFDVPDYDSYTYFSVTAGGTKGDGANVLLNGIAVSCERQAPDVNCVTDVTVATSTEGDRNLGTSTTFSNDGQTITARGYTLAGVASNLWNKVTKGDACETGLGMETDTRGNHEIDTEHYVQLDFTAVTATPSNIELTIGSVQNGEGYKIYASTAVGVLGTLVTTFDAASDCVQTITVPYGPYYSVVATNGNVLISSVLLGCNAADLPVCTEDASVSTTTKENVSLGNSHIFPSTDGSQQITARGYDLPAGDVAVVVATPSDLWSKVDGQACENGIGFTNDSRGNHEIDAAHFVQLDFTAVSKTPSNIELTIGSVQNGEGFKIYASNSVGVLGTLVTTFAAPSKCFQTVTVPYGPYYSVIATTGNVLVNAVLLACETPDDISSFAPTTTPTYVPSATPTYAPTTCGNDVTVATTCATDSALGVSKVFTSADNKQSITARGYDFPTGSNALVLSSESNLYCKVESQACETGIGMSTDTAGNHEIDPVHFVQLDFSSLTTYPAAIQLTIGSVQNGEGFKIYTSSSEGVLGNLIYTFNAASDCTQSVAVAYAKYVSVIATKGNVLINSVLLSCKDVSIAGDAVQAPSYVYAGCYADAHPRAFSKQLHEKSILYTVKDCYEAAVAGGYTVFGLQWGGECWVSKSFADATRYSSSTKCNMQCRSDKSSVCGGSMTNSVYSIGDAAADLPPKCPGSLYPIQNRQMCPSGEWCSGCQYCRDGSLCCNC